MTGPAAELDPVIHVPARLRIVVTLAALPDGDSLSFSRLQQLLDLTAGNLITHLRKLEQAGYVANVKSRDDGTAKTALHLTLAGRAALAQYSATLRYLLDQAGAPPPGRGPALPHPAAEEHLDLGELAVAHGDEFGIPVAFAGLQLVLVQDEDAVAARADQLQSLLPIEAIRGRKAAFEVSRPADVVVLRAGEREVLRDEPLGGVPVLSVVGVEHRADGGSGGHRAPPAERNRLRS